MITEAVSDAESLLQPLENAAGLVHITSSVDPPELNSLSGACIKKVQEFKYVVAHIMDSQKDLKAESTNLGCLQQLGENLAQQHRQRYKRPALPIFN